MRPVVGDVRVVFPPLRSTRTTHSTITPPIVSTAGIIASREPPVVRMSSTSRTRSPASIRKPRRNSRCVVPSSAWDLLGEDAADPELAGRLEGEDDPHRSSARPRGRRPSRRSRPRPCSAKNPHNSSSRPGPGGPGTSRRRRRRAAALEQKMPLAERSGNCERAPPSGGRSLPQRGVESGSNGRHRSKSTRGQV